MLIVKIVNDGKGTNENANYIYTVFVNDQEIARGKVDGHNRNDGWKALLKLISENNYQLPRDKPFVLTDMPRPWSEGDMQEAHLTPLAVDGVYCTCENSNFFVSDLGLTCWSCKKPRQ